MCVQPSYDLSGGEAVILTQKEIQPLSPFWALPSQGFMQCCHQSQSGDASFYSHQNNLPYTPQNSLCYSLWEPPPLPYPLPDGVCPVMVSMVVAGIPVVPATDGTTGKALEAAHRFLRFERSLCHIRNSPSRKPAISADAANLSAYQHSGSGHSEIKMY